MSGAGGAEVCVTVRMYRQGLGDCFLLTFAREGAACHVLVDCGVVGGDRSAPRLRAVAEDVARATRDAEHPHGRLDVLVATHAHWDHVSGFVEAQDVFGRMSIGEVWLPSTESLGSEASRRTAERRRRLVRELRRLAGAATAGHSKLAQGITGLLGLFGECAVETGDPGARAAPDDLDAAMGFLRDPSRSVRYLDTRDPPFLLPGFPGLRAYVLGPRPPAVPAASEPAQGALDLSGSFFAAADHVLGLTPDQHAQWRELLERNLPFDPSHQIVVESSPGGEVTCRPPLSVPLFRQYYAPSRDWRRIDTDWLGMARGLALTLEGHANDGSLALAFELPGSGKVLLFPGDARVAPPAWRELSWTVPDAEDTPREVTPADLLRRTAVYKVAHHCSQWATPVADALGAMERSDLVALVSADAAAAAALGWRLPHPPLLEEIRRRTRGRLLLSRGAAPVVPRRPPDGVAEAEWSAFRRSVRVGRHFVEYHMAG